MFKWWMFRCHVSFRRVTRRWLDSFKKWSPYLRIWGMPFLAFVSAQAMVLWPVEGFSKVSPAGLLLLDTDGCFPYPSAPQTIYNLESRHHFSRIDQAFFSRITRPKSSCISVKHWFTGDPKSQVVLEVCLKRVLSIYLVVSASRPLKLFHDMLGD